MKVRKLLGILAQHDGESEVVVELQTNPGPFRAFPITGESGISVSGAGGVCYLTIAAPVIPWPEEDLEAIRQLYNSKTTGRKIPPGPVPPAYSGAEGDDR